MIPSKAMPFEEWHTLLREQLCRLSGMTEGQVADYTQDTEAWRDYFNLGYTPYDAAREDMSYWDD